MMGLQRFFQKLYLKKVIQNLDHAGDIDYIGKVGDKAFGIQINQLLQMPTLETIRLQKE